MCKTHKKGKHKKARCAYNDMTHSHDAYIQFLKVLKKKHSTILPPGKSHDLDKDVF